jgi:sterol desaturase/sphingolipid hydroxylase (fatty acid hydroxylase superfamily)
MDWKEFSLLVSIFLFGILENIFPFFAFKQKFHARTYTNVILGLINLFISSLTTTFLLNWVWQQKIWQGFFQYITLPWLSATLSFLLLDGYMYFWHKMMHSSPITWRVHRVHHTDTSMNTSTFYRFHPLEAILSNLPKLFLVWLFGINLKNLLFYETCFVIELIFQHSNWSLPLKIDKYLSYLIITPNSHRAHHSQSGKGIHSNYGSVLTLWDRIFKTYYYPQNPKEIKLGLPKINPELNIFDLLKLPF